VKTSGIPISEIRAQFSQPIAGGVDEIDYEKLTAAEIRKQWQAAREQAGAKYIAAPGCSVPDASTPDELARFPRASVYEGKLTLVHELGNSARSPDLRMRSFSLLRMARPMFCPSEFVSRC